MNIPILKNYKLSIFFILLLVSCNNEDVDFQLLEQEEEFTWTVLRWLNVNGNQTFVPGDRLFTFNPQTGTVIRSYYIPETDTTMVAEFFYVMNDTLLIMTNQYEGREFFKFEENGLIYLYEDPIPQAIDDEYILELDVYLPD